MVGACEGVAMVVSGCQEASREPLEWTPVCVCVCGGKFTVMIVKRFTVFVIHSSILFRIKCLCVHVSSEFHLLNVIVYQFVKLATRDNTDKIHLRIANCTL